MNEQANEYEESDEFDEFIEREIKEEWEGLLEENSSKLEGLEEEILPKLPSRNNSNSFVLLFRAIKGFFLELGSSLTPAQLSFVAGSLVLTLGVGLVLGAFLVPGGRGGIPTKGGEGVLFSLAAPKASSVEVAGNFSGWKGVPLKDDDGDGIWTTRLDLQAGKYRYTYIIDGEKYWGYDALADVQVKSFRGTEAIRYVNEVKKEKDEKRRDDQGRVGA